MKAVFIGVVAVVVIAVFALVGARNTLTTDREAVRAQWRQVDVALQRRGDLIPNMVDVVKGATKQEQKVFGQIASARAALAGAQNAEQAIQANQQLTGALRGLLAVVENYPELKSSERMRDLMVALEGAENRINVERHKYDQAAQKYNTEIQLFPKNMVASLFGFGAEPYFQADEAARTVPKVGTIVE